ncbi:MAG: hypothetical protein ISS70_08220 [Phycisphaerae bacterium]|nr:hypothetical protein [Phycisphaerae bacterium]
MKTSLSKSKHSFAAGGATARGASRPYGNPQLFSIMTARDEIKQMEQVAWETVH